MANGMSAETLRITCAYDEADYATVEVNGKPSAPWAIALPAGWTVRLENYGKGVLQVRFWCPEHTPSKHARPMNGYDSLTYGGRR